MTPSPDRHQPLPKEVKVLVTWLHPRPVRAAAVATAAAMVLLAAGGCTDDSDPSGSPSASPSPSSGAPTATEPPVVAMDVAVAKVVGRRLRKPQQRAVEGQVARVVSRYVDAAYLGDYPRGDFSAAFDVFSPGAARTARADRALLTNAGTGKMTDAVVPRMKKVRLDLLVPTKAIAGVTARLHLVFVEQRSDIADQRVTVDGRLLLGRARSGGWEVFGYDVARSSVPTSKGARR